MDFAWTKEENELYQHAYGFARGLHSEQLELVHGTPFPLDCWRRCAEFGLLGLSVPECSGGAGLPALATAHIVEAFGRGMSDSGLLFAASAHLFACSMPAAEFGDSEACGEIVRRLAEGRWIGANAISEPGAGSDTSDLKTRAVRDGGDYVLTGEKCYVTNGPVADVFLVYATTRPGAGYFAQSAFVVPRETPGLSTGAGYEKLGLRNAPLGPVYLDGCRIPSALRLGAEGQGARIFARSMAWERSCLFAAFVGAMEAALDRSVDYAKTRIQARRPIARYQAVSHRLAEMKRRLEAARLLVYKSCWVHDRGDDATLDISLAKLAVSEAAIELGLDAIRIHGGLGYLREGEGGIASTLLDGIGSILFSGTSDIQRELVAHRLLTGAPAAHIPRACAGAPAAPGAPALEVAS